MTLPSSLLLRHRLQRIAALTLLACVACLPGCGSGDAPPTASIAGPEGNAPAAASGTPTNTVSTVSNAPLVQVNSADVPEVAPESERFPVVLIKTTVGDITVKLNAEKAPQTVANFLDNYVQRGYYDNTAFHYVEQGFMIIGGGFDDKLQAKEARAPVINEANNGLKNRRGTIAMARNPEYIHGATSQFFFNLADNKMLDHTGGELLELEPQDFGYCVFGEVIQGMDVVEKIGSAPVHDTPEFAKTPTTPIVILSAKVIN